MPNHGFQSALLALVLPAGIGMALALVLLGSPRKAPQERLGAAEKVLDGLYGVPVSIQNDERPTRGDMPEPAHAIAGRPPAKANPCRRRRT